MKETFVRSLWNKTLCILSTLVESEIVLSIILFLFTGYLCGGFNLKRDTIFGNIPIWLGFGICFQIFIPIFMIIFYEMIFGFKYDKEYKEGLIPFYRNTNQPMFTAKKSNNDEPTWKENYTFEAKLKLLQISYFCGRHALAKVVDINTDIIYFMFATRWLPNVNGYMVGNFTFDTNWKISNIYKVK